MRSFNASSSNAELLDLVMGATDAASLLLATLGAQKNVMTGVREGQYSIDVVTDNAIREVFTSAGVAVFSEESGFDEVVWPLSGDALVAVVDPLDGSTNADRGIPWYSTSIALIDAVGLRIGVVKNQANGDVYVASRGEGATRNGMPIRVAQPRALAQSVVGVSAMPDKEIGWWQFRALGSAALDLCLVASRGLDAWVDFGSHGMWDYAAGMLIVQEAGGAVDEVFGRGPLHAEYDSRRTIVAASTGELLQKLVQARK